MERSRRERELWQAAARVFQRIGLQQARLQDVADELDVPRGVLYYYVASKADLVRAVIEVPLQGLLKQAQQIAKSQVEPEAKLACLIEQHVRSLTVHPESWALLQGERREVLQQTLAIDPQEWLRQYEDCWKQVISEGIERDVFSAVFEPDLLARVCIGLLQGLYCWNSLRNEPMPQSIVTWLAPLVLQYLHKREEKLLPSCTQEE